MRQRVLGWETGIELRRTDFAPRLSGLPDEASRALARGEVWRRGESNPCFDDSYPTASADVLPEGTRERSDRRGSLRMALDVITFVITYLFVG